MISQRRGPLRVTAIVTLFLLLGAAAAFSATSLKYKGKTSQGLPIKFRISGKLVKGLDFRIKDTCPSKGKPLFVRDFGFSPPMQIAKSKFGGTFHGPHGDRAVITGKISGKTVRGTLSDHTKSNKTHKFCNGTATYKVTHK
jgi:hypothetical protein